MPIRSWSANLKVRLLGEALFNMLFWMYFPFITVYFGDAFGNGIAGLLMTVPPLFSLIGSLAGGAMADRLGRRPVMLAGTTLQTLMFALFALSPSPWVDYAAFIGIGLAGAVYRPASTAMVADLVPVQHRRQVFATYTTANNIGAVLGPAIGAVLFFRYRQELLWACSGVMLLYFSAIFLTVRETLPTSAGRNSASVSADSREGTAALPAHPVPSGPFAFPLSSIVQAFVRQMKGYGVIFRDKVFLVYSLAGIFSLVPILQLDMYLAVYITNHVPAQAIVPWHGAPVLSGKAIFGWLLGFNGLLFVLFILPVTNWFHGWRERDVFILSSLLSGVGTFLVGVYSNFWYLFVITIVFTFGEMVRSPVSQSFIARYAPEHARGQYMGADNLQYTFGKFLAPLTVFLSGWLPPMAIFSVILGFAAVSIGFYVWLFRIYREPSQQTDSAVG
ncbi:MDR family MFS transporter [Gorillibacterium sp. sgz500922]|uniref:MDR family MFS transporter n=1 Tax=Gorillibacterium sp. sgz500922 TaxID=3446694 RepID=UPI003F670A14